MASLVKEIKKSPFKNLKIKFYLGRIQYGTPYFNPVNFVPFIFHVRKLQLCDEKENMEKFKNLPFVRRNKYWIIQIFKHYFFIEIGFPIKSIKLTLTWKQKYDTPRFEWGPSRRIFFFNLQFCIFYTPPLNFEEDLYWEMYLWWKHYCDKNLIQARQTWPWIDSKTNTSAWNDNYLKQ